MIACGFDPSVFFTLIMTSPPVRACSSAARRGFPALVLPSSEPSAQPLEVVQRGNNGHELMIPSVAVSRSKRDRMFRKIQTLFKRIDVQPNYTADPYVGNLPGYAAQTRFRWCSIRLGRLCPIKRACQLDWCGEFFTLSGTINENLNITALVTNGCTT